MDSLPSLELLGDLGSNSVHVGLALLGEGLSNDLGSVVVGLNIDSANKSGVLELLENVSDALSGALGGVLGSGSVSLLGRVVLSQGVDSDLASHVELVGD